MNCPFFSRIGLNFVYYHIVGITQFTTWPCVYLTTNAYDVLVIVAAVVAQK